MPFPEEEWERGRWADRLGFVVVVSLYTSPVVAEEFVLVSIICSRNPIKCISEIENENFSRYEEKRESFSISMVHL